MDNSEPANLAMVFWSKRLYRNKIPTSTVGFDLREVSDPMDSQSTLSCRSRRRRGAKLLGEDLITIRMGGVQGLFLIHIFMVLARGVAGTLTVLGIFMVSARGVAGTLTVLGIFMVSAREVAGTLTMLGLFMASARGVAGTLGIFMALVRGVAGTLTVLAPRGRRVEIFGCSTLTVIDLI